MRIFYQANQIYHLVMKELVNQKDDIAQDSTKLEEEMNNAIHDEMVPLTMFKYLDWQVVAQILYTVILINFYEFKPMPPLENRSSGMFMDYIAIAIGFYNPNKQIRKGKMWIPEWSMEELDTETNHGSSSLTEYWVALYK